MSIRSVLAELPSGQVSGALPWPEVSDYLSGIVCSEQESKRRDRALRRSRLYRDDGREFLSDYIKQVFEDRNVLAKRDRWVEKASYNNVLKRVIRELATLYRKPAQRSVADGQDRYQAVQELTQQHEKFRQAQALALLHRYLLVGFRVTDWNNVRKPRIEIAEPQNFFLVPHPLEHCRLIGVILDYSVQTRKGANQPAYTLWTDTERAYLNNAGRVLEETVQEHGLGRMPWSLLALEPPPGEMVDLNTGEDLVAAHLSVWFQNVCLLKESKSATKIPIISGDVSSVARAQAADTEVPIEVPDGTTIGSVDMAMDLTLFSSTADHILERVAANYGIPPSVLHQQGATSGYEIELRLVGIRERRLEQEIPFREFEREFVEIQATVLAQDMPELSFSPDGFSINFGDTQMPRHPTEALQIFERERQLGLTDTVDELMRRDPDLTADQAKAQLEEHIAVELMRNELMRPIAEVSGGLPNVNMDPGNQDNGQA